MYLQLCTLANSSTDSFRIQGGVGPSFSLLLVYTRHRFTSSWPSKLKGVCAHVCVKEGVGGERGGWQAAEMAGLMEGEVYQTGFAAPKEEAEHLSGNSWYFSREKIEQNSPSRRDGISLFKENQLRKSYCIFLQDLGMRLKVPQVTIATSIVFCHRFFLRHSHAKNDRYTIATACMFLAGKVEETPKLLQNVLFLSYEIRHKRDPIAVQRIKLKEVYDREKELVLLGECLVLTTLDFDLNVNHPYKPLVTAVKKLKVAQNALAQVAWNFLNDGLRTSLCLQFKAHHIAAGAIFLAAKFLKVKLPTDGDTVWWHEFEVTARQLEDVSNQMLELYEQHRELTPSSSDPSVASSASVSVTASEVPPRTPQVAEKRSIMKTKAKEEMEVEGDIEQSQHQDQPNIPCIGLKKASIDDKVCVAKPKLSEQVVLDAILEVHYPDGVVDGKHWHAHDWDHHQYKDKSGTNLRHWDRDVQGREHKRPCYDHVK